ncbi:MAG: cupin domain-containing protein [Pseudomonadota bacterium]
MKVSSLENTIESEVSHNARIKKKLLVSNGEVSHLTNFSRAIFPPGEIAGAHSHSDMTEIFLVESGEGVFLIDEKSVPLKAGTCVTVTPNEVHELRNTGSDQLIVLYFGIET